MLAKRLTVKDRIILIDAIDYEKLSSHCWYFANGYICREKYVDGERTVIYLHRLLNQTPEGFVTDHINGDKLDNRMCNLRTATKSSNAMNTSKRRNKSSGFRGVQRNTKCNTFSARIKHKGKTEYLGSFKTKEDAALAYNIRASELFGEVARLNRWAKT